MNVEYATHSPPRGQGWGQMFFSETYYRKTESANQSASVKNGYHASSESKSINIDANGGVTTKNKYGDTSRDVVRRASQEPIYNDQGFFLGFKDEVTYYDEPYQTVRNGGGTATLSAGVAVNSENKRYLYNSYNLQGYGEYTGEAGEEWDAYKPATRSYDNVRGQVTVTRSETYTTQVSGGKIGMEEGQGDVLTESYLPYTATFELSPYQQRGTKLQGNTRYDWGTYDADGKYLVARGANVSRDDNKLIFAKTIVLENCTDAIHWGYNANALPQARQSYIGYSTERDQDIATTRLTGVRVTNPVSQAGGLITGRVTQQETEEQNIGTIANFNVESYDLGENWTVFRGGVVSAEIFKTKFLQQLCTQTKLNVYLERGLNYENTPTTDQWGAGRVDEEQTINTGKENYLRDVEDPYTTYSFRSSRTIREAYSDSYRTNLEHAVRSIQLRDHWAEHISYDRGELIEAVQAYKVGNFVSGKGADKKYFSCTFDGSMMPAVAGQIDNYVTSISTKVGMGMGNFAYSFDQTQPAQKLVNSKTTTYALSAGTYKTEVYTNVSPYRATVTSTIYNYSTLVNYTNRSIRAHTNSNILGLPTIYYSAHISTDDDENSYIESCKYTLKESTVSQVVRDGVFALSNCDDEQLFNYAYKRCGQITVNVVTVALSAGDPLQYQLVEGDAEKVTYTKNADQFENRHGYKVSVNNGKKDYELAKTVYFSPKANLYTYHMATTTKYDTDGFIKCTMPDWFTTQFNATQRMDETVNFSIMPYLPTTFELVDRTTIYGALTGRVPEVIGTTHWATDGINGYDWDYKYHEIMMVTDNVNHNHYRTKVVLSPFYADHVSFWR